MKPMIDKVHLVLNDEEDNLVWAYPDYPIERLHLGADPYPQVFLNADGAYIMDSYTAGVEIIYKKTSLHRY